MILMISVVTTQATDTQSSGSSAGEFLKVGAAGGQFLKVPIGARACGMGGAYGAVTDDLTSIFWNPAGLADIKGMSGSFSYTQWFAGFSHNFGGLSLPIGDNFTVALSAISFNSDRIEITTLDRPEGTGSYYTISDVALGVSFAGYLTDQFSFGITAKYVNNAFADLSANGFAFDVGTMYETGIQGIKLGFSIHNLGTDQQYTGKDLKSTKKLYDAMNASPMDVEYLTNPFSIPIIFRAGVTSDIITTDEHNLIAALDFLTLSDTPEQFILGAEYTWSNLLSIRGGYIIGQDQFNISGGVGVKYIGGGFAGQIDYSISPTSNLGLVNRLTVNLLIK